MLLLTLLYALSLTLTLDTLYVVVLSSSSLLTVLVLELLSAAEPPGVLTLERLLLRL